MSLLLVVVLLFFSSSCSVSSGQYYVSDDCSSVTQSPCNPLSTYTVDFFFLLDLGDSIFYFVGTSVIDYDVLLSFPGISTSNITLQGIGESSIVKCVNGSAFKLVDLHHFNIMSLSFHDCGLVFLLCSDISFSYLSMSRGFIVIGSTSKVAISNSTLFKLDNLTGVNALDFKIESTIITGDTSFSNLIIVYFPPIQCDYERNNYSFEIANVSMHQFSLLVFFDQSSYYHVVVDISGFVANGIMFSITPLSSQEIRVSNTSSHSSQIGLVISNGGESDSLQSSCDVDLIPSFQRHSHLEVRNCQFYDNMYGLYDLTSNIVTVYIDESIAYNNIFGLMVLESSNVSVANMKMLNNERNIIAFSEVHLTNVSITSNTVASGLTLKRAIVTVSDSLLISNNTGTNGGGLAVYDDSYLKLLPGAQVDIVGNHATEKGGGIYTNNYLYCPFQSNFNLAPVYVNISSNFADLVGHDIYGIVYKDNCTSYFSENVRSADVPRRMCFCDPNNAGSNTNVHSNCLRQIPEKNAFPGQELKFNIIMTGLSYSEDNVTAGEVNIYFDDSILMERQPILANCSSVEIKLQTADYTTHNVKFSLYQHYDSFSIVDLNRPLHNISLYSSVFINNNSLVYSVFINECPIGFSVNGSSECDCSQSVYRQNVTCDINTQSITHNGLLWIGTYDTSTPFNANVTNPNACIINEDCLLYCSPNPVTFKLNDTDTQCVDNRGQRMCGSCRDGYSLLMGSNKCGHCDDKHTYIVITWLLLFAVMGVLLVFLLIALNLTVSVGTLNGLLFYANIVKLYEPVFSREGALPVLKQVISWINLDFGFEACLYNGMDSYAKQWLQFAFPLYLWIVILIIIQLCRRYGKISRLMGSHAVPVLSTLFLLSYTKLVRTIVIVLHQRGVTLHCTSESVTVSVWYEDPNVEYAKGKHAGLLAFALVVFLFFVLPYTLFLLLDPLYEKYLSNYKVFKKVWGQFKPIIDAYSGPMKDEYRFWPGLLLVARIPILLSVTLVDSFIQSQNFLLCMLLTVLALLFSMQVSFGGLYRKRLHDIIEVWFLFNLCIMVSLSIALNTDEEVLIWFNTCIGIFTISFIVIIFYHFYLQISNQKWFKSLLGKICKKQKESSPTVEDIVPHKTVDMQMREKVPTRTILRKPSAPRESVVELF